MTEISVYRHCNHPMLIFGQTYYCTVCHHTFDVMDIVLKERRARQHAEIAVGIIHAALAGGAILFVAWLLSNLP